MSVGSDNTSSPTIESERTGVYLLDIGYKSDPVRASYPMAWLLKELHKSQSEKKTSHDLTYTNNCAENSFFLNTL